MDDISKLKEKWNANKEDYKLVIISSGLILIALGFTFVFSFFVGSYILFTLTLLSFIAMLIMFSYNIYNIIINREEVKRLENLKNNKLVLDDRELSNIFKDIFTYIKNGFYGIILRILDLIDGIKIKF